MATHRNVQREIKENLRVAESVFERLFDARFHQLIESVQVLAADFGFKQAVATAAADTIVSVLENHGARANANLAVFTGVNGRMVASTGREADFAGNAAWLALDF